MISQVTLEYPYVILIFIIFLLCEKLCKKKSLAIYFPNTISLKKRAKNRTILLSSIKFLTILSLLLALSSPIKKDAIIVRDDRGYEISLILDASGSMSEFNKFNIVKGIVDDFITKREHDKLALSIFADFAYVAVPLTYDKKSIRRLLDKIDVGIAGEKRTALYEALFLSSNLFKESNSKDKIAILLTDGIDNTGSIPLDVAINRAKKYGIKVYTIGVGTAGNFNPSVLKKISNTTGGKYFTARTITDLENIYKTIDQLEKSEIKADKYIKKSYLFQIPLAVGLILLILYFYLINRR